MAPVSFSSDALFQDMRKVVHEAGLLLREHHARPRVVRHKGRIDLVTQADVAVEAFLTDQLHKCLPEADFLAEEGSSGKASLVPSELCWIIDPVDGTTNFAHGLPLVGISVALWNRGRVEMGAVNAPLLGEFYTAALGYGAFCNGVPIVVSGTDVLNDALVATGFPYTIEEDLAAVLNRMEKVLPAAQGVRRCGAASLDLAWVAAGRFDAFYENRLKPWDVAAGWLLVEEAGGRVSGFDGSPHCMDRGETLASNGRLHAALSDLLREDSIAF